MGWVLGLALLVLALPRQTHAQDVAFSLTQQVVGDTLEVTLSGQSLDAQPDSLLGFVLNFSTDQCLDIGNAIVEETQPGQLNGYLQRAVSTTSGLRLVVFQNSSNPAILSVLPTNQTIIKLSLPFDASVCATPSVQLLNTTEDKILGHNFNPLSQ